jgi:hypothetical protein
MIDHQNLHGTLSWLEFETEFLERGKDGGRVSEVSAFALPRN